MIFPDLIPEELLVYQAVATSNQLFELLIKKPLDLLLFFEAAADDETWSERHADFMKRVLDWMTEQQELGGLSQQLCVRVAKALHKHEALLQPMLQQNVELQFKDGTVKANSLLLSTLSPFFQSALPSKWKGEAKLSFARYEYATFIPFEQFMRKGCIPELYRYNQAELFTLLRQAAQWAVRPVVWECEQALVKYLSPENALDWLETADKEHWDILKRKCVDFLNASTSECFFYITSPDRLGFAFKRIEGNALDFFERSGSFLTDFSLSGTIPTDPRVQACLRKTSKLVRLDLSRSDALGDLVTAFPKHLQELDLSECPWLGQGYFKRFAERCPNLIQLNLSSNIQLNYVSWGELHYFARLEKLDLSRCRQINSQELKLILKACPGLHELNLSECSGIGEEGFILIGKSLPELTNLSLVRCAVNDSALAELAAYCKFLKAIDFSHCSLLTEKGVRQLVKQLPALHAKI
jgi:hypothetical protein